MRIVVEMSGIEEEEGDLRWRFFNGSGYIGMHDRGFACTRFPRGG